MMYSSSCRPRCYAILALLALTLPWFAHPFQPGHVGGGVRDAVTRVRTEMVAGEFRDASFGAAAGERRQRRWNAPPMSISMPMSSSSDEGGPELLKPFVPALDPMYPARGPVGESDFVLSRSGPPLADELSNEQMLRIVRSECTDLEANTLVWKCLGYRFDDTGSERWTTDEVFPKWAERFPEPPDLIGMARIYSREADSASLRSNQALVRSVPVDNKQSLKEHLTPLGWKGYQYKELTPNKTRRAQCANWLIFYREELFGYTVDQLRDRRQAKRDKEEVDARAKEDAKRQDQGEVEGAGAEDTWKPPVKEVY